MSAAQDPPERRFSQQNQAFLTPPELIDPTNRVHIGPKGFYMNNVGPKSSTPTNHYYLDPKGNYTDWWITFPASSTNPFTWS